MVKKLTMILNSRERLRDFVTPDIYIYIIIHRDYKPYKQEEIDLNMDAVGDVYKH